MKKIYCVNYGKRRKFKNPKISHIFEKTLVISIICDKCGSKHKRIFKEAERIEILKILGLINNIDKYQNNMSLFLQINMTEGNISQEFRLKKINETRNYFVEKIEQNELISKKHKKVCTALNYIKNFNIIASTVTGCVSISAFASLLGIPIEIASSAIGLKICELIAGVKKYKSIIKKIRKKHDKRVLLAKS